MTYPEDHMAADMDQAADLEQELRQKDEAYERQKAMPSQGEDLPDGTYQVVIENVGFVRSKGAGHEWMLKWMLRVVSGSHAKRALWRNNMIATEENLKWLKTDLATAGLEIQKLSEIQMELPKLIGVKLEVKKVTSVKAGISRSNIYFQKRIEVTAETTGSTDEEVPF